MSRWGLLQASPESCNIFTTLFTNTNKHTPNHNQQSLAKFLSCLPPTTRGAYLPLLCDVVARTGPSQWRPREALAGACVGG
jgi:hypothetical protein